MNIRLFDRDPTSAQVWREFATSQNCQLNVFSDWGGIDPVPSTGILFVLDQSVIRGDFVEAVSEIRRRRPHQLVIATGANLSISLVARLMRCGASYVLAKPLDRATITSILPEILEEAERQTRKKKELEELTKLSGDLTSREMDVLQAVLNGFSNKETAAKLSVSVRTIESRRAKVYRKMHAANIVELVRKVDRLEHLKRLLESRGESDEEVNHCEPSAPQHPLNRRLGLSHPPATTTQCSECLPQGSPRRLASIG